MVLKVFVEKFDRSDQILINNPNSKEFNIVTPEGADTPAPSFHEIIEKKYEV